ncbi:MAG: ribosomal protein S18-alanine N-acetyltransferase [Pseudomonadota bacterium]
MDFTLGSEVFCLGDMCLSDISQLVAVEAQAHSHPWTSQHFKSSIESSHHCYILKQQSNCVAYCIVSTAADEAELLNITVLPAFQRRGIASRLLQIIFDSFEKGIHTLFLEVRLSNSPAIALYQSLGFNEVGRRPHYYPAIKGREDALIMARALL